MIRAEVIELLQCVKAAPPGMPGKVAVDDGDGIIRGLTLDEQLLLETVTSDELAFERDLLDARVERLQRISDAFVRFMGAVKPADPAKGEVVTAAMERLNVGDRAEAELLLAGLPAWRAVQQ